MRSHCCLCVPPNLVARQLLSKHIPVATDAHPTIEELLDAVFSMWSVLYQIFRM
jgi:hypothetical protein